MELVMLGVYDIEQNLSKINYLETIVLLEKDYEKKLQKYMFATIEVPILQTQKRLRVNVSKIPKDHMIKTWFKKAKAQNTGMYLYKQLKDFFGEEIDVIINRANLYIDNL